MRSRYAALLATLLLFPAAAAQTPGSCELGQATAELSLSDVRARVFNIGGLFWRGGDPEYEVPRDGDVTALFNAGLWFGGTVGGEIRTAAARFGDWEFWPGPLDDGATLPNPDDCSAFDRIYQVTAPELAAYEAGNPPSAALAEWPVGLGAPAVDANGAPVVPTSREQVVDLEAGERPVVYGTETLFWVMNDVGNDHDATGSTPLGIEVRVSAFSVNDPDQAALDQGTFYRVETINRSAATIEDLRLGAYADQDLGDFGDDYVGSDPERGLFYAYNSDDDDEVSAGGYGTAPPAIGIDVLSGAAGGMFWSNTGSPADGRPESKEDYYNYLGSRLLTGAPLTRPDGSATPWYFDGDPVTRSYWSETDVDPAPGLQPNQAGDRRGVVNAVPVDLAPGASYTVDLAIVFARGTSNLASVTELRAASDLVQARYDDGSLFETTSGDLGLPPLAAPTLLSPDDGTVFMVPETVVLDWEPVADATAYRIEFADNAAFTSLRTQTVLAPPVEVDFAELPMGSTDPIYWRVAGLNEAGAGPTAEARAFTYAFTFQAGVQLLSGGQPAILEVAAPGGANACGDGATSTYGCDEAGGNAVFSLDATALDANATGLYTVTSRFGYENALTSAAPREIEIRFTAAGSIATHPFGEGDGGETHRVPFEVWDIGLVPLGADDVAAPNDPADDVRLVPVLFSDGDGETRGACAFDFGEIPADDPGNALGVPLTDRIYAYYPATTYDDFEAAAAPLVDAAPEGCYLDADQAVAALLDRDRGRVVERIVLGALAESATVADLDGAVVRFYTTDPQPVSDEAAPTAEALALTVVPNPSRGAARVQFATAAPGAVRVRVLDVLGREVAVVAEGERRAGAHEVALPSRLASGVYVVAVEVAGERAARTFTVVR